MQAKRLIKVLAFVAAGVVLLAWLRKPTTTRPIQADNERTTNSNAGLTNQASGSYYA